MKKNHSYYKRNFICRALCLCLSFLIAIALFPETSHAETDLAAEALLRKELPIQTNDISGWPHGPEITAQAAIVLEANTGTILYAKNIHERLYPASTTKIMTCLLAVENASLSDMVTFSDEAVFSVPKGGSNIGMDVGQAITMEQALYGIMVGSANEVANAVGEHISGSISAFVDLMNKKAKDLGCTDTHFVNTNGLQDDEHYTSAYDLAIISKEFFSNDILCKVGNTARYHFTPTNTQPDDFYLKNKHKLINGEIAYEGIMGGKTGYTALARETLVTCAEKNGLKLICVVFKEESPTQFTDTVTLFDYGFNNFEAVNVYDSDKRYMPNDSMFFESNNDVFGRSGSILKLDRNSTIILPKTATIEDTGYDILYDLTESEKEMNPRAIARVNYRYNDAQIGKAYVCYSSVSPSVEVESKSSSKTVYINVKLLIILALSLLIVFSLIGSLLSRVIFGKNQPSRSDRVRYNRRKKEFRKKKGRL